MSPLVRTQRPFTIRIIDLTLTGLGWLAFSYLVASGLIAVLNGVEHSLEFPLMGGIVSTTVALLLYLTISAVNALLLMLWGTYRKRLTRIAPQGAAAADDGLLAENFALSKPQLQDIRLSRMLIIHHAENGQINHWESADTTSVRLSA